MTAKEIFELRNLGNTEKAYEAARRLYATDKSPYASSAMFWTAVDMLRWHIRKGHFDDAYKILLALERLRPNVPDKDGWVADATAKCRELWEEEHANPTRQNEEAEHSLLGKWGEKVAAYYLYGKGYDIVETDWHSGHRDIDIIVQRGQLTVFVEVKTRRNHDFGDPIQAIDYWKRYNLRRAITHYVRYHKIEHYRFDIITIVGERDCPNPEITHIEDVNITELETRHYKRK